MAFLTDEDKAYLKKVAKYLQSTGLGIGIIEDYVSVDEMVTMDDIMEFKKALEYIKTFSRSQESVPQGYKNIISKILDNVKIDGNKVNNTYNTAVNVFADLNYKINLLTVGMDVYYNREEDSQVEYYEDEIGRVIDDLIKNNIKPEFDNTLSVSYDGGGDSGWIENTFSTGETVPKSFEDWGYLVLSENFGGWELDSGSKGSFEINFTDRTITINHIQYIDQAKQIILFEESF
jgi:hypothetical protein